MERSRPALVFCAGSYICLGLFDALAVRYAGKPLALHRTAIASFCGLSIGHTVGLAALSSGAVRYRFYARLGPDHRADRQGHRLLRRLPWGWGLAALAGVALVLRPQATAPLGMAKARR